MTIPHGCAPSMPALKDSSWDGIWQRMAALERQVLKTAATSKPAAEAR